MIKGIENVYVNLSILSVILLSRFAYSEGSACSRFACCDKEARYCRTSIPGHHPYSKDVDCIVPKTSA